MKITTLIVFVACNLALASDKKPIAPSKPTPIPIPGALPAAAQILPDGSVTCVKGRCHEAILWLFQEVQRGAQVANERGAQLAACQDKLSKCEAK